MDQETSPSGYIHGSSPEERDRLSLLNTILNEACLKELDLQDGEAVLDLGSGLGQFTCMMAKCVGPRGRVLGIDQDPSQIEQAKKLSDGSDTRVEFRQGDVATKVPLDASEWGMFDVVHARFLLEHVPKPQIVVERVARAVRPGGRIVIIDDDHGDFRPWPEPTGFADIWRAYVHSFEVNGCDPFVGRKLVSLLSDAGLRPARNGGIFFGGCSGDDKFDATASNLISAFHGAKDVMLSGGLIDAAGFQTAIDALAEWKRDDASSLWYSACFAVAVAPT